ncbi:protein Wnt-11b-2-like [Rhinatrema bivittatum]|uniref:protein Wnt-11b-2-like n=1 Tax=Rhinatrema bivittatum TaxID=194408 RepID=UPI00112B6689|nr:protein Wnt-11b-2-like [Rhinatrema bivittatum]
MARGGAAAFSSAAAAFLCLWRLSAGIQWLGLPVGQAVAWNESQHCRLLLGLVPEQVQLCRRNLELMSSIVRAALETKASCQKSFADMRWNCSSIQQAPDFTPDILKGTRESAFVHALSAAAVGHSIARACASAELPTCSCGGVPDDASDASFRWGGCGDNLPYGLQMGSAFTDAPMKSRKAGMQASKLMNLHNNAVGRQALADSLETKCKCHGISGSCSVKTCWKGLQDLGSIARELKARYLGATKVILRHVGLRKQLVPKELDMRPVRDTELVYLASSPDYCSKNPKLGSQGTQDRQCQKSSMGSESCSLMCCGRGYNAYTQTLLERCHCKYHWCCYVTCKKCERTVEQYVCK